jgi:hypothetical protein
MVGPDISARGTSRTSVEVWDADRTPPRRPVLDANGLPPETAESGRGLFLVAALRLNPPISQA